MIKNRSQIGKQAFNHKHFRWIPGMLDYETGLRFDEFTDDWEGECPDIEDMCTAYCLLKIVREEKNDMSIFTEPVPQDESDYRFQWEVSQYMTYDTIETLGSGKTENDAIFNSFIAL